MNYQLLYFHGKVTKCPAIIRVVSKDQFIRVVSKDQARREYRENQQSSFCLKNGYDLSGKNYCVSKLSTGLKGDDLAFRPEAKMEFGDRGDWGSVLQPEILFFF